MTQLDPDDGYVVLINTFGVDPDRADDLLGALSKVNDEVVRHQPGFVSANLHLSLDRRSVANYSQWRSKEDLDRMFADPQARQRMAEVSAVAESWDPIFYTLREIHGAPAGSGHPA